MLEEFKKSKIIIPSILEKDQGSFDNTLSRCLEVPAINRIHIDYCDISFTTNQTLYIDQMTLSGKVFYEFHYMSKVYPDIDLIASRGFSLLIVHIEAFSFDDLIKIKTDCEKSGLFFGVAVNPATLIEDCRDVLGVVNFCCVMGVVPGYQGQLFDDSAIEKINKLKAYYPDIIIEVDGGVNLDNIKKISKTAVDIINCGSVLVRSNKLQDTYVSLVGQLGGLL